MSRQQAIPKIPQPIIDDIPRDYVEQTENISQAERENIFLNNGGINPSQVYAHNLHPSYSRKIGATSIFVGTVSLVGLFLVYRAIKLYA